MFSKGAQQTVWWLLFSSLMSGRCINAAPNADVGLHSSALQSWRPNWLRESSGFNQKRSVLFTWKLQFRFALRLLVFCCFSRSRLNPWGALWRSGTLWRSGLAVIRREEGSVAPCDQPPRTTKQSANTAGPRSGAAPVCLLLSGLLVSLQGPNHRSEVSALLLWLNYQHFLGESKLSLRACLHGSPDKR